MRMIVVKFIDLSLSYNIMQVQNNWKSLIYEIVIKTKWANLEWSI